ncbi:uncharacterized protein [Sinocyclocheilus grahami]|uniref:uncharacterized protein isoform X1 n=1 Tax=Sinocyclocheilus grahami TaxID=75366 RepID=UPI0007AD2AA3|nr:PREDICTED: uncharacterized protein LOC107568742 isoform X1 [Sinocyclocheilus grahami]XP_016110223.1 PREDICTED: uncharacterized protein LOC107568742 isoform X2 [Sinocyclocheilus grahami]
MSENHEGEQREQCEEARFVDENYADLIQNVTPVMPIADELYNKGMIHAEKYAEIKAEKIDQEKMRKILESLKSDNFKTAFYYLLEKHAKHLFNDLGGVSRKRKLADPECSVPCKRLNTESIKQDSPNYNNASNSAPRPAPTYIVTNIVNERPHNLDNITNINEMIAKKEKKPPAPKAAKKPPAPKAAKKPPAPKAAKKPPAPKKAK